MQQMSVACRGYCTLGLLHKHCECVCVANSIIEEGELLGKILEVIILIYYG